MQETLNSKKKGDVAFRHKDFSSAIECYSQVSIVNNTLACSYQTASNIDISSYFVSVFFELVPT